MIIINPLLFSFFIHFFFNFFKCSFLRKIRVHLVLCYVQLMPLFLSCVSPLAGELALASPESVSEHLDVLFPKLIEVSEILEIS